MNIYSAKRFTGNIFVNRSRLSRDESAMGSRNFELTKLITDQKNWQQVDG